MKSRNLVLELEQEIGDVSQVDYVGSFDGSFAMSWEDFAMKFIGETYTPDFVIYNENMEMVHVYDVKSSINAKHPAKCATDIAKSKFRRFMTRYDIPVEVVVPRTHDFKMAMISFTKKLPITYHKNINYDIGRYVGQ